MEASAAEALHGERPAPDLLDTPQAGPAALRGGALRTAAYVVGILLSLVSAPLLIRHLGVEDFGRYATITSLVLLVGGVTDLGLSAISVREYTQRTGADRDATMRALLGMRLAVSTVGIAGAVAFAALAGYGTTLLLATVVAGLGLLVQITQGMYATSLHGRLRYGWMTTVEVFRNLLVTVAIAALVLAGAGLLPFFAAQAVATVLAAALTVVLVRGTIPLVPAFHPSAWWPVLRQTLPAAGAIALQVAYFRVTLIGMSLLSSARETGWFATSFRVLEVVVTVPALAIGAAFPILARSGRDDAARFTYAMRRILELSLIVGLGVAVLLVTGARVAITLLAGSESDPSVGVLRIQSPAIAATFVAASCIYALLSVNRHRALLAVMVLPAVVAVALTLALAPTLGAEGAAIATLCAELAVAGGGVLAVVREWPELGGVVRRAPVVIAAAAVAAAVLLVPGVPPLLDPVVGIAVYVALIAAAGRFPPEVRDALRRGRAPSAAA